MTQPSTMETASPESDLEQRWPDPVLSEFEFPLQQTFYPLGFPLELSTNSADVMDAAAESWGSFAQAFQEGPMRFSLGVVPGEGRLPLRSTFRSREHLMSMFADASNFVISDFNKNFAFGWVTQSIAKDHAVLQYRFLKPTVMMLAEHMALAPIHGALIARNGNGILLCGDSLSGKSTLSYACARAGWTFVCDDGTLLVRKHSSRYAIGNPTSIRFREDARRLFPELAGRQPKMLPISKLGFEVFTRELPITTAPGCVIEHIVFLNRNQQGPARLRPYSKDQALAWCERTVSYGTSEVRADQLRCYQRLADAGVWELCYRDFDDAISRLEQLVDSGA
jgi:hypothetical protein